MYEKIYSRPRIKFLKLRKKRSFNNIEIKKDKRLVMTLIILIIAFSTLKIILDAIGPIFDTICQNRAESIATIISNEQATNVMKQHSYEEMFTIQKDANDNITMISSNIISINEIISDVAIKIQNEMDSRGREDISIALRKLYRIKIIGRKRTGDKD